LDAGIINTDYHVAHTINTFNQAITFLSNKRIMPPKESKLEKAREVVDILEEISMLLVCAYPQANKRVSNQKAEHTARPFTAVLVRLSYREWRQPRSFGGMSKSCYLMDISEISDRTQSKS
jgi:hypothetical protein